MRHVLMALLVALSTSLSAAEPQIRLPISVAPVVPSAVTELAADAVFVIEADIPCLVLASRVGFVDVIQEEGPLRIRGKFSDGTKVESRTYKAKHLWIVEALAPGEVEILVVPSDAKDASAVIRRTLVVKGQGPRPPPDPEPKPIPPPDPPPDPVSANPLTIVIVEKPIERTPQSAALIANIGYWNSLEPGVKNVHIVPDNTPLAAQYKKQIADAGGKLPVTIIMDSVTHKVLASKPLPADTVEMSALVNKYLPK